LLICLFENSMFLLLMLLASVLPQPYHILSLFSF